MSRWLKAASGMPFGAGLALGLCVGLGMFIGTVVTLQFVGSTQLVLPETALHASATHSSDTLAAATGLIDDEVEGLYVLDYLTGELQCAVLNHRNGKFNSVFRTNVLKDLGADIANKRPKYLMLTGLTNFVRGPASARPALSVIYVVDAYTGRFAAYGFYWRKEMARSGRPQQGAIRLLDIGNARTAIIRD